MSNASDTYQLKWNSFTHNLHTSVASAINNTAFADVFLYTIDGEQILAHRFVLSACSHYLHQILKLQAKNTTTSPLAIVLPPEINYKTMKTLLQYMYSGETTVTNDILESVLRGGDLLKVKGLWKPDEDNKPKSQEQQPETNTPQQNKVLYVEVETQSKNVATEERRADASKNAEAAVPPDTTGNTVASDVPPSQYFVIKEEPLEWNELEAEMMECGESMFHTEMTIKAETTSDTDEKDDEMYSPLTCELCSEVFTMPGEWVKHIQSHTDMLPAKRQRRGRLEPNEIDDGSFPPLQCDMCQQQFDTPAEWVRHIETAHTELELRVMNKTGNTRSVRVSKYINTTHKECDICNKKFPSHASMLIHQRTHTGERPFICDHCQKGFNVKSNLLRHLRTLHDKLINSSDIEYKEESIEMY